MTTRHEGLALLPLDARPVVEAFVAEHEARRRHLVVYLSGAHAYGFPSPDSDVDLKAVHVAPTRALVGVGRPRLAHDVTTTRQGVELDYTSNGVEGIYLAGRAVAERRLVRPFAA
jgi:hypothetical protein